MGPVTPGKEAQDLEVSIPLVDDGNQRRCRGDAIQLEVRSGPSSPPLQQDGNSDVYSGPEPFSR
jgi:hypothetical protein